MGDRSSPDVAVGPRCHVQKPAKRFGANALEEIKDYVWEPLVNNSPPSDDGFDQEEDDADDASQSDDEAADNLVIAPVSASNDMETSQEDEGQDHVEAATGHHRVPHVARARSNLTLYFAAYQNKVYVYQPQRAPQILPPVSLILRPRQSHVAELTGGVLDRSFPHQMNYITVGDLGDLEILLLAFDDGDIVAYYTHLIVNAVEERGIPRGWNAARVAPKPFFHENVGASAWGLAIHTHSRLIAASSNRHDVTVFALALTRKNKQTAEDLQSSPKLWSGQSVLDLEKHFRSRTRTWRVVLPIGNDGHNSPHNIPSIAFCDDADGNAERVAAVDINGNTWLLDIWNLGGPATATLIKPTRNMLGNNGRGYVGWSILLLPNSSFKPAVSNQAAMGLPANEILGLNNSAGDGIKNDIWLDITASLYRVKDNAADPKTYLLQRHHGIYSHFASQTGPLGLQGPGVDLPLADTPIPSDDDTDDEQPHSPLTIPPTNLASLKPRCTRPDIKVDTLDLAQEKQLGFELGLTIVPGMAKVSQPSNTWQLLEFFSASSNREQHTNVVEMRHVRLPPHLSENFSIMRATTTSVELQSLDNESASVLCRDVLPHHNHHRRRAAPWDLNPSISERITMYLHVPELGLVVLGSLNGRVALLSLTRPPRRHGFGPLRSGASGQGVKIRRAFRIEAVLPRKKEEDRGLRPWCTLHGIAISPVPDHRAKGLALLTDEWRPRSWRLILHYMDHTILMYDISRHEEEGNLLII
ncbi:hypothetical protein BR93DRAFT_974767 [Coniochaeta sp. PMI_546]|nr:hypothetical protein BR93DRAFT_974767 [Coniochaeta sp. PMI_546]